MYPLFRAFKRHYHKARNARNNLSENASLTLEYTAQEGVLHAKCTPPHQQEIVRFAVLIRRFLNPLDPLYYGNVWTLLQEQFGKELSDGDRESMESRIASLNRGPMGINIDGTDYTAEQLYHLVSNGEYFAHDEESRSQLTNLASAPVAGPLIWYQFYAYNLEAFALISILFEIVRRVEESDVYRSLYNESGTRENRCIYCLSNKTDFKSEEHIFPESLGNDELVLPKGYVCEKCNHGILAELDSALLRFGPIAFLQVLHVPYTKAGQLPRANFQNVHIRKTRPRHIVITAKDRTGRIRNRRDLGNGWCSFTTEMKSHKLDPKLLGRALYKVALGMVAFSQGPTEACKRKYNPAREFILEGIGCSNNLLMCMKGKPQSQVRAAYVDVCEGTPFAIDIFGLAFLLNLENEPTIELNEELARLHFASLSSELSVACTSL